MQIDGKTVYVYILAQDEGLPYIGFDEAPIDVIRKRWFAAWKASALMHQARSRVSAKVEVVNALAAKEVLGSQESEFSPSRPKSPDSVKFAEEPGYIPTEDVLLNLNGIPTRDGYGSVSVFGDLIRGVAYVDHDNLSRIRNTPVLNAPLAVKTPGETTQ